jgi:hypothetical protein
LYLTLIYSSLYRSLESDLARLKEDQIKRSAAYEKQIYDHKDSVGEYQKLIKSLGNEKAVLSAAVEARDSKLIRMDELKQEVHSLKEQVVKDRKVQTQMVSAPWHESTSVL